MVCNNRAAEYVKNYQAASQAKVDVRDTKRRAKNQVQRLHAQLERFKSKDEATNKFRKEAALAQASVREMTIDRDRAMKK